MRTITAGTDYTLSVSLKGTTVSVSLNGMAVVGYAFNSLVVDGAFGVFSRNAPASFDIVSYRTNDRNPLPRV